MLGASWTSYLNLFLFKICKIEVTAYRSVKTNNKVSHKVGLYKNINRAVTVSSTEQFSLSVQYVIKAYYLHSVA